MAAGFISTECKNVEAVDKQGTVDQNIVSLMEPLVKELNAVVSQVFVQSNNTHKINVGNFLLLKNYEKLLLLTFYRQNWQCFV